MNATRRNRWWIPSEGIARVVISADIQRYLGPDALVKPGDGIDNNEGIPGYWITAPRTLTSEMIQDLKQDTQRWEMEQREAGRRGSPIVREGKSSRHPDFSVGEQPNAASSYEASATYRSRHYYGPSETQHSQHSPHAQAVQQSGRVDPRPAYEQPSPHYTTSPYGSSANPSPYAHPGYHNPNHVPRTNANPYASQYGQTQPASRQDYAGYPAHATHTPQPQYGGYGQQQPNPYQQPNPSYPYASHQTRAGVPPPQRRQARPGYYIASDGNEYQIPPGGIPQ